MMRMAFSDDKLWHRAEVVVASWMGTPYRHLQMVKQRGADCTLFLGAICLELGILKKVEHDYYPRDWHQHTQQEMVLEGFLKHLSNNMVDGYSGLVIKRDDFTGIERGDVPAFSTVATGVTNHAGIYMDNKKMVHSINGRGVAQTIWGSFWIDHITTVFRIMKWD